LDSIGFLLDGYWISIIGFWGMRLDSNGFILDFVDFYLGFGFLLDLFDSIGFNWISIGLLLDPYWDLSDSIGSYWIYIGFDGIRFDFVCFD
jgi:hypothetical protein